MGSHHLPKLLKLQASERLSIAEELWASVSVEEELATPSDADIAFVNKRLDAYLKNPDRTIPWSQIKTELGL